MSNKRRICYVTGTRAEFGLMRTTLEAIRAHRGLELQLIATGMHLSAAHGRSVNQIVQDGFSIDAKVPWRSSDKPDDLAIASAEAQAKIARQIMKLDPHIVMVCGDRVEAFAAASAAHLGGRVVAHVHGGDRAMGQLDDALRHAITKLSHLHLCATKQSADRIYQLGEDRFRIHRVGTPGIDGISKMANHHRTAQIEALIVLHPDSSDPAQQFRQTRRLVRIVQQCASSMVMIYPNNDPGWTGIVRGIESMQNLPGLSIRRDLPRAEFLGMLRSAKVLIGNSSAGIIEAASLGTPVVNIGDRQLGRQRSRNVVDVGWEDDDIHRAIRTCMKRRFVGSNVYGGGNAGLCIAKILSDVELTAKFRQKIIRY